MVKSPYHTARAPKSTAYLQYKMRENTFLFSAKLPEIYVQIQITYTLLTLFLEKKLCLLTPYSIGPTFKDF